MRHQTSRNSADRHGNAASRTAFQKADDTKVIQETKHNLFYEEQQDKIEHFHEYGFTNVPKPPTGEGEQAQSAEAINAHLGSNRTHGMSVVVADRRFRLYKLEEGEVALHDDQGHQIHFKRDGIWHSAPNSKKIVLQIMKDDKMPQDDSSSTSGGQQSSTGSAGGAQQQKLGQIKQAGRDTAAKLTLDKNGLTIDHPNGAYTFNCKTFTVNASSDIKMISGANALLKGASSIVYATGRAFVRALSSINVKSPVNKVAPDWVAGPDEPPITS